MLKKLLHAIKQRIAIWVLNDPRIILRFNNQSVIEEKYEIIELNVVMDNANVKKYYDDEYIKKGVFLEDIDKSPLNHLFFRDISQRLATEIIEKKLIKIQPIIDKRLSNDTYGYIFSTKVLKHK